MEPGERVVQCSHKLGVVCMGQCMHRYSINQCGLISSQSIRSNRTFLGRYLRILLGTFRGLKVACICYEVGTCVT